MRIPSAPRTLGGGLRVVSGNVHVPVWQEHVIKHPFGLDHLYGLVAGRRRWNAEGWDKTDPVVLDQTERARLVAAIRALEVDGVRCGAERLERTELHAEPPLDEIPCRACEIAVPCSRETVDVSSRYAGFADRLLDRFVDAEVVPRAAATARVMTRWREAGGLPPVLSTGMLKRVEARGARINAPDGVRVELYLDGGTLRWRTTYRRPSSAPNDRISHLLEVLAPVAGDPLSGHVLLPRPWWRESSS